MVWDAGWGYFGEGWGDMIEVREERRDDDVGM